MAQTGRILNYKLDEFLNCHKLLGAFYMDVVFARIDLKGPYVIKITGQTRRL